MDNMKYYNNFQCNSSVTQGFNKYINVFDNVSFFKQLAWKRNMSYVRNTYFKQF